MELLSEDKLTDLIGVNNQDHLLSIVAKYAEQLEFDYCSYGLTTLFPLTRVKSIMHSNYPTDWQDRYNDQKYLDIDPVIDHAFRSRGAVLWSDPLFAAFPAFWAEAQSFGIHTGLAQACRNCGGLAGLLVLARSAEKVTFAEWQSKAPQILWLTHLVHDAMYRLLASRLAPIMDSQLSLREIEILRWTADGKTSGEIAGILSIAERTVTFHVQNAITKLQVNNKTAAVAKAITLNFI